MAFHPYPQLIRAFCNRHRFGPPPPLTAASPWPWVAHAGSGWPGATPRPFRTRCRCGSGYHRLSLAAPDRSPDRSTKSTPSPHQGGSDGLSARGFRHSFTPRSRGAFHLSLTVLCAIGRWGYLALDRGRPRFPPDCTCPAVLTHHPRGRTLSPTGLSPAPAARSSGVRLGPGLLTRSPLLPGGEDDRTTPGAFRAADEHHVLGEVHQARIGRQATQRARFGLRPFRSPLLRASSLLLGVLRCFTSPGSPPLAYIFSQG